MMCYCNEQTFGGYQFWLASSDNFIKYAPKGADGKREKVYNYCWGFVKLMIEKEFAAQCKEFTVVILNSIISYVFVYMGELLMMHTTIE